MELNEIKSLWNEMSEKIEAQEVLTNSLIMEMTQQRYKNTFSSLKFYETIGGIICLIAGFALLFNLDRLDTWYLLTSGIICVVYLIGLPLITLNSIWRMSKLNILNKNLKQTLTDFYKRKRQMLLIQQLGIAFNFLLVIVSLPVIVKISNGKDLFLEPAQMYWYVPGMFLFLAVASRAGYRCYKRIAASAQKTLEELEG
ncbi:MAG: hypothetical protein ABJM06_04010 [Gilvibacter sp.]